MNIKEKVFDVFDIFLKDNIVDFLAYFMAPSESDGPDKFHLGLTYHTLEIHQGGKISDYGKVGVKA